jgi:hypothetical protein
MDRKPWDIHPELLKDRLVTVASILHDVRHEALPNHEPDKGDTNWGLGTRVSERTWHALREAAYQHPWLRIINPSRHFVFSIGSVPFRFYRGLPEKPNSRVLLRQYPEIRQHQMAFEFFEADTEYFWRLAIETDIFGEVLRIVVAQMSEMGDVKMTWEVPLTRKISVLGSVSAPKPEGIELPSPVVYGKKKGLKLVHGNDK